MDEVAGPVGHFTPASHGGAVRQATLDHPEHAITLSPGDQRPDDGISLAGISNLQRLGGGDEHVDGLVVEAAMHDDPRRCGTDLPRMKRPHRRHGRHRLGDIAVGGHNERSLPAEFHEVALHRLGTLLDDACPDDRAAGEADHVDELRVDQG